MGKYKKITDERLLEWIEYYSQSDVIGEDEMLSILLELKQLRSEKKFIDMGKPSVFDIGNCLNLS